MSLKSVKKPETNVVEIEFTAAGPKDLAEVNQAVLDSARYLKEHGFVL